MNRPTIRPGIYRHYKGAEYRVLFEAFESTNSREAAPRTRVVVYFSLEKGCMNVRDLEEFVSDVTVEDEGDAREIPRFVRISD